MPEAKLHGSSESRVAPAAGFAAKEPGLYSSATQRGPTSKGGRGEQLGEAAADFLTNLKVTDCKRPRAPRLTK